MDSTLQFPKTPLLIYRYKNDHHIYLRYEIILEGENPRIYIYWTRISLSSKVPTSNIDFSTNIFCVKLFFLLHFGIDIASQITLDNTLMMLPKNYIYAILRKILRPCIDEIAFNIFHLMINMAKETFFPITGNFRNS